MKITPEQLKTCISQGLSSKQIAEMYGMSPGSVRLKASKSGLSLRGGRLGRVRILTRESLELCAARNMSKRDVAEMFGVAYHTVTRACKQDDIQLRRMYSKKNAYRESRAFRVMLSWLKNPELTQTQVAALHNCSREFARQVKAFVDTHGICLRSNPVLDTPVVTRQHLSTCDNNH